MKKRIFFALLIAIVVLVIGDYYISQPSANQATLRHLSSGDIIGFEDKNNSYAWLGIPFVQPPLGDLRWRAPRPAEPWKGVREALEHGPMCSQISPISLTGKSTVLGEEDCLYLNIWTPRLQPQQIAEQKLPVMVWIHGGGNTVGTSDGASGFNLAGTHNVVVVTLQYRLGIFGWFSHPALRETASTPADISSNFALLDMIAALQWVRDNIAAFGGDPDNVTIFGQSAGGHDVFALLAAKPAQGLFHRAISQSGAVRTVPQAQAENFIDDAVPGLEYSFRELINRLLIANGLASNRSEAKVVQQAMTAEQLTAFLRNRSVTQLFEAVIPREGFGYFTPINIRDNYVLPRQPLLEVFADPTNYNAVPMILGSNRDEFKFFLWMSPRLIDKRFGVLPEIRDLDEYNKISAYFSDQWLAASVDEPASVLSESQPGGVFAYRFDWADQKPLAGMDMSSLFGAAHGLEIPFVFGADAVNYLPYFTMAKNQQQEDELSRAMMAYWTTFAKTGDPGNGGDTARPQWKPWQNDGETKLIFNIAEQGGIRMISDVFDSAALKQRLRTDTTLSSRERCELYAQLFLYSFSSTGWNNEEYQALGCEQYPVEAFSGINQE